MATAYDGKLQFALQKLQSSEAYRHDLPRVKRHLEQALKGAAYNIPVCITIPADYPILAPECFVEPTSTMELNLAAQAYALHPEDDGRRGRVETPAAWAPDHSSLIDIIIDACRLFSISPPVKSRPVAQPRMPAPYATQHSPNTTSGAVAATGNPVFPSYNPAAVMAEGSQRPSISYAPHPPAPVNGHTAPQYYPQVTGSSHAAANPYPAPHAYSSPPLPTEVPSSSWPGGGVGTGANKPAYAPTPPRLPPDTHVAPFRDKAVQALAARLQASLQQSSDTLWQEVATLEGTADKLAQNRQALTAAKQKRLQQLQAVEANVSKLGAARQELDAWLRDNESKASTLQQDDLQPSDVIVASDALSDQAIQAQAQDMAIEDCLDALGNGLNSGAISLDAYVRNFRLLCEDQYKCRLLGVRIEDRQKSRQQQQPEATGAVQLPQGDAWGHTATYPAYPTF